MGQMVEDDLLETLEKTLSYASQMPSSVIMKKDYFTCEKIKSF